MDITPIPIGAFDLLEPIGIGGVAEVWRGLHRQQQVPVAVKIMTSHKALLHDVRDALRNEVRAIAGLDHPNIITVLSYGELDARAAERSQGRFRVGSPYIIMELASLGTLRAYARKMDWEELRQVLLAVLDALAHAHARRVIHLDLKPPNVLVMPSGAGQRIYKLGDFGISHITWSPAPTANPNESAPPGMQMVQGTPPYMAPEQFTNAYRDFGSWTDMYALGCLAWSLITGKPPFNHRDPRRMAQAHFWEPPPPFEPQCPVPKGLEPWLQTLLRKRPCERFQRAADAAYALKQLGDAADPEQDDSDLLEPWEEASGDVEDKLPDEPATDPAIHSLWPGEHTLEQEPVTQELQHVGLLPGSLPPRAGEITEVDSLPSSEVSEINPVAESLSDAAHLLLGDHPDAPPDTNTGDQLGPEDFQAGHPTPEMTHVASTPGSAMGQAFQEKTLPRPEPPPIERVSQTEHLQGGRGFQPRVKTGTYGVHCLGTHPQLRHPLERESQTTSGSPPSREGVAIGTAMAIEPPSPQPSPASGRRSKTPSLSSPYFPPPLAGVGPGGTAVREGASGHSERPPTTPSGSRGGSPLAAEGGGRTDRPTGGSPITAPSSRDAHAPRSAPANVVPLPRTWHMHTPFRRPLTVVGAGLSLYGLRAVPLAGRMKERDVIWNALRASRESSQPRVLILEGPSGTGKSRLAEWVIERAHEVAGAEILRVLHSPNEDPAAALSRMVERHYRCAGMAPEQLKARLKERLADDGVHDEYEWTALSVLASSATAGDPFVEDGTPAHQVIDTALDTQNGAYFEKPAERYALLSRLIRRTAASRPVVIWMDDVQWGSDALSFVDHLLTMETDGPVLVLLTVQEEALAERPVEQGQLEGIKKLEGASALRCPPLSTGEHFTLVRDLLGLEGALAKRVVERTGGNPLFAVQMVRDWVQRDLLDTSPSGFRLKQGAALSLPDDLKQIWAERIHRLLQGQPEESRIALELAAAIGTEVRTQEWQVLCKIVDLSPPEGLLELLLSNRLAQVTTMDVTGLKVETWTFVHGMLRESLEQMARDGGRYAEHKWQCGTMLLKLYGVGRPGVYERLGRYALAAGEFEAALLPLLKAASFHRRSGDMRMAQRLLAERDAAIAVLALPDNDRRLAEGWLERATLLNFQGKVQEALSLVQRVDTDATRFGWQDLLAESIRLRARSRLERGDPVEAIRLHRRALQIFEALGNRRRIANCYIQLASCEHDRGDMKTAAAHARKSLKLAEALADVRSQADAVLILGHIALMTQNLRDASILFQRSIKHYSEIHYQAGVAQAIRCLGSCAAERQPELAAQYFHRALSIFNKLGYLSGEAKCRNDLAELARSRGDLDAAEQGYRRTLALCRQVRSGDLVVAQINLALVLIARGNFSDARTNLEECRKVVESVERHLLLGAVHGMLLACAAADQDWRAFDGHHAQASLRLSNMGVVERDDAWSVELAGDLASRANRPDRAHVAYSLALTLWKAVRQRSAIDRLKRKLHAISAHSERPADEP